ncbi:MULTISPECIES: peptide-methionine (S)-S-oxide reductase MsrA [unclassified Sphingomonas]|uniref:peptide-methionine (S)-S-oxide reductase MsrA n=1 Tax=unclassified Sphingomonas TaxID=196159 RepID=UPI000A45E1B6|nr:MULTISPECIES: peptide-methionine (S)-S-oxide reductase MsrA [unclassified Sphingomonas]MBN8849594.1 peptide-methionine (S)-S-oxide reductase MsrA [Sphingomonas sp.]MBS0283762.1 peptide-methionine (S)-S-oxide reductase MsrA [Pseudomonadota bacterium]
MYRPLLLTAVGGSLLFAALSAAAGESFVKAPAAQFSPAGSGHRETAIFAGGCFWGVEGVFDHVKGVVRATSGYAGGGKATADYETVSTGTTGHAESVEVVFDPAQVRYADLLRIYFSVVADPTTLNRQGPDSGTQYRSALFPRSPAQEKIARAYLGQLRAAHVFARPIVTAIEMGKAFYPAEGYHQNFMARHPAYPYIVVNDRPKVEALKRLFPSDYRG